MLLAVFLASMLSANDAPETWFHIIGGNASKEGLTADVRAIAEAGIGGIQFFHGQFGPASAWPGVKEQIPCLSPKWDDLVAHLADACASNGLTFKMQNCPGWSMSGGPWIDKDHCMRKLVCFAPGEKPAFDEKDDYREIATVTFPVPAGETPDELKPDSVETNGDERVYRFSRPVTIRSLTMTKPSCINYGWCYEPKVRFRLTADGETVMDRDCPAGCWADFLDMTVAPEKVRTASVWRMQIAHVYPMEIFPPIRFSSAARLDCWEQKSGVILRDFTMSSDATPVVAAGTKTLVFGHCNTRQTNHPAPKEATGWECDKMDAAGFEANFNGYIGRLLKGPLAGKGLKGLVVDSWECGATRWTPKMEAEFRRMNGYELRPWLPALFGHVLVSPAETERFLLDWRRTCSRLVEENYYGTIARLAHEHGLTVQYETAFCDVLTGDPMRYWKYADEPMCEFWSPFDNGRGTGSHNFKPVRPCVSAAHVYGKRRVSAEAFTNMKMTFDETLQSRKEDANVHLCRGVTHLVFHTYTHNPVIGGLPPGSTFGSDIGTPFLRGQTWWPFMRGFTRYLAVCGHELERGRPVVDILWYLGDAFAHKPDERGDRFGPGYKYDYLNRDALETRLDVKDGRFVLPDGMSYRVLWVPKGAYLLPDTEKLLSALEKKGGRIVRGDFTPDWPADVEGAPYWYHRRDGDESIYFVANHRQPFKGTVRLREWAQPLEIELAPGEGRFIYVKNSAIRQMEPETGREPYRGKVCGEQALDGWSRPLGFWKDLPGTRAEKGFSGTRDYVRRLTRPFPKTDPRRIVLDLGDVRCCARVKVNGTEVARLWCPPFRVDLTESLEEGESEIVVEVTSTWRNRLIVDAGLREAERQTWTIKGPSADQPFVPSGWAGPARLLFMREGCAPGVTAGVVDRCP